MSVGQKGTDPKKSRRYAWTEGDDAKLRSAFEKGGIKKVCEVFPTRTRTSLLQRANRLGLKRFRFWSKSEDAKLRRMWGEESIAEIAKALGRTERAVHVRATHRLGLPSGCPDGYEHIAQAARRVGYDFETLRKLLVEQYVEIRTAYSYRTGPDKKNKVKHLIVRAAEVDNAIEHRLSTETVLHAAKARNMCPNTLRGILVAEGLEPPDNTTYWTIPCSLLEQHLSLARDIENTLGPTSKVRKGSANWRIPSDEVRGKLRGVLLSLGLRAPRVKRAVWRINSDEIDAALKSHAAKREKYELIVDAAARYGVTYQTMSSWLRAAGVKYGRSGVPRDVIDRVARAKRDAKGACETIREASRRHHVSKERLSQWLVEAGVRVIKGNKVGIPRETIDRVVEERRRRERDEYDTVQSAAHRYKMAPRTVAMILRQGGLNPRKGNNLGFPRVDVDRLLNAAIARRAENESIRDAAKRIGVSPPTLVRWLKDAGVEVRPGSHTGVHPSVVDKITADRRDKAATLETLVAASRRLSLPLRVLRSRLVSAGVRIPRGNHGGVDRSIIDQVVETVAAE